MRAEKNERMMLEQLDQVRHWIIRLAGAEADGEDLFQDVSLICCRLMNTIEWKNDQTRYLMRLAKNRWIDQLRSTTRRLRCYQGLRQVLTVESFDDATIEQEERRVCVRRAVASLPTHYRDAISRRLDFGTKRYRVGRETQKTRERRALKLLKEDPQVAALDPSV